MDVYVAKASGVLHYNYSYVKKKEKKADFRVYSK